MALIFLRKLAMKFQETLPGKRVFFIYTHRNGFDRFYHGLKANTEISFWSYNALKSHFPRVTFLKIEKENPRLLEKITPQDVVIGHIGETFLKASQRTRKVIAFYPWSGHIDRSESTRFNCLPKEKEWEYLEQARAVIFLTSEYNVREYIKAPKNFWYDYLNTLKKSKTLRIVHQPIDLHQFLRIKHEYNTSDFLYVGNDAHMKCLEESKRLVKALNRGFHIFGVGENRVDNRDQKLVKKLAQQADFFIQPGMWEGQCVSILEAAARGFIPVVSPETGYPYSHPFLLRYNDFSYNLSVLQKLLKCSSKEKRDLADDLHQQLTKDIQHNQWKMLTDVLVEEVKKLY